MNHLIRPFRSEIPQRDLDDLTTRLGRSRCPDPLQDMDPEDRSRGIPQPEKAELVENWRSMYDCRTQEAALNQYLQFATQIDGQDLHYVHVRSRRDDAVPLLLLHGNPSSFAEFTELTHA